MSEDPIRTEDMARVQEHVTKLSEHFDSVQVFCARHEEGESGGTININLGAGNYFTRYGHVRNWCVAQDEQTRIDRRNEPKE